MSIDAIRRRISGSMSLISDTTGWTWAACTSAENAGSPTYGTEVSISVLGTGHGIERAEGPRGEHEVDRMQIRVPAYGVASLPDIRDRITDAAGRKWLVVGVVSRDLGTTVYAIEAAAPKIRGMPRGRNGR